MIGINLGKIIGALFALILLIFVFLFLLGRRREKKSREELEDLRKKLVQTSKLKLKETPEKDMELLDRIVEKIGKARKEGSESVELSLGEEMNLRLEAPDVISLRTPRTALYKSFSRIKFRELEELDDGVRLYIEEYDV